MNPLMHVYAEVVTAVQMHVEEMGRSHYYGEQDEQQRKWRNEQRKKIYSTGENDEVQRALLSVIKNLEQDIRQDFML
jgi:hypothetical protein